MVIMMFAGNLSCLFSLVENNDSGNDNNLVLLLKLWIRNNVYPSGLAIAKLFNPRYAVLGVEACVELNNADA